MQKKTILIIGFVWPEPSTTAAGTRMLQLIHFFLKNKYQLTFASAALKTKLSFDLVSLGISNVSIKLNDASFDTFIKDLNPDIVVFDRFLTEEQFGWRVAECTPRALRVLNSEDLHSLRKTRENLFKNGEVFTLKKWQQTEIAKREVASIFRCDLSLIISTYEMQLLSKVIKMDERLLHHLPFLLEEIKMSEIATWPSFESRKNFICIGNGKHAPNIDAIDWLKNEIWPLIHNALPECELSIYGAYLPEHINQMHNPKEGFLIKGWVEDVKEVMINARLNLAPLRFGAGIKGKLTDAMQCGTPSVTTTIGIEGMLGNQNWDWQNYDNATEIAEGAIDLYLNRPAWLEVQQTGVAIINKHYNKELLYTTLLSRINDLQRNLDDHRSDNFIGAMLMHHAMQSTKYLSKWIEAKNK